MALCAACLAVVFNELFSSDKVDMQDCVFSTWSAWEGCTNNECTGFAVRTRTILKPTLRCTNQPLLETISCFNLLNCQNPDCQYSGFGAWSDCPNLCFNNELDCNTLPNQVRFRTVVRPALPGGLPCNWESLIERRPCAIQEECIADVDCVAGPDNPQLDCNECPDVGCTLTGQPYWTMCTRSIVQSQSGNGSRCSREQLLYSSTCDDLPDCTEQCIGNDFGAFSRCSVPCGNGFFVSSTVNDCPDITVGSCSNGSCTTGAWSLTTNTTCTTASAEFCTATDAFSFTQCFAKAAQDPDADRVFSVSGGLWFGSSSTMSCGTPGTPGPVWEWVDTSTECLAPTWDMVNAVCLFLCDANNPNVFSQERGFVFPFSNGSLSCPITPYLLSASGACPIDSTQTSGRPFGQGQFPNSETFGRSLTDPYTNDSFTILCPLSHDCIYQSFSDAPPWNICQNPCVFGGGERSRYRSILSPASFLGKACSPLETIETVPCNQDNSITSATDMWCSFSTASFFSRTTELKCFEECSATRADPAAPGACNSMFLMYQSHSDDSTDREIFLASSPAGTTFTAANVSGFLLSFTFGPISDLTARVPTLQELQEAFDRGAQSCLAGFFNGTGGAGTNFTGNLGALIQQTGCGGSLNEPGIYKDLPGNSQYMFVSSRQKGMLYSKSSLGRYVLQPFFTPTTASSPLSDNFTFTYVQSFSDGVLCALQPHRMDQLLLAKSCTSLSAKPLPFVTSSNLVDVPCDEARDCSVTDWVSMTSCSTCRPPEALFMTRTVVQRATEGGVPCDLFSLVETVPCPQSLPLCTPSTSVDLCLPAQFPQVLPVPANECDLMSMTYGFLEAWNEKFIFPFATLYETVSNLFGELTKMTSGLQLQEDLAVALNAQALNANGSAPLCVQGVNSVTRLGTGNVYEFSISAANVALGWKLSSCVPDNFWSETTFARCSVSQPSISKRVYDFDSEAWVCPSVCPYLSNTCVFLPNPSVCDCGVQSLTARTGYRAWKLGEGLTCTSNTGDVAAIANFECPNPYVDCPSQTDCPPGCDGTPCNSASGFGICSLTNDPMISPLPFYTCSCNNGSSQSDCGIECPIGPNGLTCSGRGTCEIVGTCTCDAGFSGIFCERWGTAVLGLMEGMLLNAFVSYSVNNGGANTWGKVSVSNMLPCNDENNPACQPAGFRYVQGTALDDVFRWPLLGLTDANAAAKHANMCIDAGDAMVDASNYVPGYMGMFPIGSLSCQFMTGSVNEQFSFTAQFVSNSKWVPDELVGKRFNVRCMNSDNTIVVGTYTLSFNQATQFAPDGTRMFDLVGYGTETLKDLCS